VLQLSLGGLAVEQRFFAPGRATRRGEAIGWSIGWLALARLIAGEIAIAEGPAGAWTTVYLIERSLRPSYKTGSAAG
jgi:hypothetical protein